MHNALVWSLKLNLGQFGSSNQWVCVLDKLSTFCLVVKCTIVSFGISVLSAIVVSTSINFANEIKKSQNKVQSRKVLPANVRRSKASFSLTKIAVSAQVSYLLLVNFVVQRNAVQISRTAS